jgi:hypothetical protein
MLEECHDVTCRWQVDKALLEPHEPIIDAAGHGLGFLFFDLADPKGMLLSLIAKNDPPASVAVLKTCHDAPRFGNNLVTALRFMPTM